MGLLLGVFLNIFNRNSFKNSDNRASFIFYKIVDSIFEAEEEYYKIQCINTKAIFHAKITDIIFDLDILHGLHPVQACYIGIEYAQHLKNNTIQTVKNNPKQALNKYSVCRYGNYELRFQDRKGNVSFIHKKSRKQFLIDPRDVAFSKELIEEFDAAQAFYIGLRAGLKLNNLTKEINKHPRLRIVK